MMYGPLFWEIFFALLFLSTTSLDIAISARLAMRMAVMVITIEEKTGVPRDVLLAEAQRSPHALAFLETLYRLNGGTWSNPL